MSKKHFDKYFQETFEQYKQMTDLIKDLEKEVQEGLCPPEKIDQLEQVCAPLKNNYLRLSYVMYLLNQPNRDKKAEKYKNQNKRQYAKFKGQLDEMNKENKDTLNNLKSFNLR